MPNKTTNIHPLRKHLLETRLKQIEYLERQQARQDHFTTQLYGKRNYNEEKELGSIAVGGQPSIFFRQADFIYDEEVRRYERVDFTEMKTYDRKKQTITSKAVLIMESEEEDFNFGY